MRVTLHRIPLDYTQPLGDFRKLGPATLDTHGVLCSQVRLDVTQDHRLSGELRLEMDNITRQVRQDERVVETIEVPALRLTSDLSSGQPEKHWTINRLQVQGKGVSLAFEHAGLDLSPSHLDVSGTLQLQVSEQASRAALMGFLPAAIELQDTLVLRGTAGVRIPWQEKIEPRHVAYDGQMRLQKMKIEGSQVESLTTRLKLAQGRLTIEDARANVRGGNVRIASPSYLDLQGPMHEFDIQVKAEQLNLQTQGGRRLALSRMLFLLAPLFILEPGKDHPVDMSGILNGNLSLSGTFSQTPGWSKTVNGQGFFRVDKGSILGSTLVSSFTTKMVLLPWNTVHNSLTGLFTKDNKVGAQIVSMGRQRYVFGNIASPIQVRAGEVHLQPDFAVRSPEFGMLINGHSTLEGEMDYLVRTDIIERLRFGAITSLPNKIPLVGKLIRYVNSFTLLEGIELEATVQGNVFRLNDEGKRDVRVETSIIRGKKTSKGGS